MTTPPTLHAWCWCTAIVLLFACSSKAPTPPNRWSDKRLWPILEAQEHRDTDALCALLKDSSAVVREGAALALASVQSSASIPCLLNALTDREPMVRATAAFALGFVADSTAWSEMPDLAMNEHDTTVQRALFSASFLAMQRGGRLQDPGAILHYLRSSHGHERLRAADALRRLPDTTVHKLKAEIVELLAREDAEVRPFLVRAMRKLGMDADTADLFRIARVGQGLSERVEAVRVIGAHDQDARSEQLLWEMVRDEVIRPVALEALTDRSSLDGEKAQRAAMDVPDTLARISLLGLAMRHSAERTVDSVRRELRSLSASTSNPYQRAATIRALSVAPELEYPVELLSVMQSNAPPIVRQAAFQGLVTMTRAVMMRSRYASAEDQYQQLSEVVVLAIHTKDPGLICAAAELLQEEEAEAIRILLPARMEQEALASLHPIRDLEARLLLQQVIAKRDGLPAPAHTPPAFNHSINKEKLLALKQGQHYRITTSKGTIVIATDVNDCPGSSLAFDSLVTAGYYDGKAFHRMVPNFVAQGGCPRGDGYGGMPWTLRTEIGRKLFTAGSVGLASAGRDTESCQFFITHSATPHLDGHYTRFGEVVEGMDVVWRLQVGDVMEKVERLN